MENRNINFANGVELGLGKILRPFFGVRDCKSVLIDFDVGVYRDYIG